MIKKCYCGKELDKSHTVYCSKLCQNRYQAKYKNGFKGKHHKQELKDKWSIDRKNRYNLSYHKENCPCAFCKTVRNENKNPMLIEEVRNKMSKIHKGRKILWADKISNGVIKAYKEDRLLKRSGIRSNWYIDGRTSLRAMLRQMIEYKEWKQSIFKRDRYTCQQCFNAGGRLNAHHIKPFYLILDEFLITYSQFSPIDDKETLIRLASTYKPFWDINNGKTLCKNCHKGLYSKRQCLKQ